MMEQNKTKSRRVRPIFTQLLLIVVLCFAIVVVLSIGKDVALMINLSNQSAKLQEELEALEKENANLIAQKEKFEDEGYIQAYARGNYMFSRDGEQIFYLPKDSGE